jgi:uncharacterized membrane protein
MFKNKPEQKKKEGAWFVLKKQFIAGLLAIFPISFSIFILLWLFEKIDLIVGKPLSKYFDFYFYGFGFLVLFAFIWLTGLITSSYFGGKLVKLHDRIVTRIPILGMIFRTIKQLSHTVLDRKDGAFTQPVLLELFQNDQYLIGFITSREQVAVPTLSGETKNMVHVFVPTVPNPTTGFMALMEEKKLIKLNISVEEAFKTVISAGIIFPPNYQFKNAGINKNAVNVTAAEANVSLNPRRGNGERPRSAYGPNGRPRYQSFQQNKNRAYKPDAQAGQLDKEKGDNEKDDQNFRDSYYNRNRPKKTYRPAPDKKADQ